MSKNTSYDWLVIAETKAQCEGTDVVNSAGNYGFLLTAMDSNLTSSASRFGIIQPAKAIQQIRQRSFKEVRS